jgi:Trypsin-co-occurring domain 1
MDTVMFPLENGEHLLVRVQSADADWGDVVTRGGGVGARLEVAQSTFEAALDPIRVVALGVLERLSGLEHAPDEVKVDFGLELSAKAGAILAVSGTANLNVSLTWRSGSAARGTSGGTPRSSHFE